VLDLTNLKKDLKDIVLNCDKLYADAKERKKEKEKPTLTLKDIYDIDNIASESSKKVFLDSFVKNFEQSVCELFFVREDYMLTVDDYINLLHKLGFIKFDVKRQREFSEKKTLPQEEEKKAEFSKDQSVTNPLVNNSNIIQNNAVKTAEKSNAKRGRSENPEERVHKKLDKELKVVQESWKYFTKKEEKVNTNHVLVLLAGILGLYEGEKPAEIGTSANIKVEENKEEKKEEKKEEVKEEKPKVEQIKTDEKKEKIRARRRSSKKSKLRTIKK